MSTQLHLLQDPSEADNVRWLEGLLRDRPGWMTAAQIVQLVDKGPNFDRTLRKLASLSKWLITGQKGYKHVSHATAEEVDHFENWMLSQSRQMAGRALAVKRNFHRVVG